MGGPIAPLAAPLVAAALLGLTGSVAHCVGMCSGVTLLVVRAGPAGARRRLLGAHLGRIATYALLGAAAGALGGAALPATDLLSGAGHAHSAVTSSGGAPFALSAVLSGLLAMAAGGIALYTALAILGRVPPIERALSGLGVRWGRAARRLTAAGPNGAPAPGLVLGLLWGLLPCGLVWAALLAAAATGGPLGGGLTMLAFGLGTLPALGATAWLLGRQDRFGAVRGAAVPRWGAALVVSLLGLQLTLRGLAAWGLVGHLRFGGVMVW